MFKSKKLSGLLIVLMLVSVLAVGWAFAGKGKGKKPKPTPCQCAETIELPDGTVCTLEDCGSDCVYACPLPF